MPSQRLKIALATTAGFALGIGAASLDPRPTGAPPLDPSQVGVRPGHLYGGGKGTTSTLRPVGVMVGGESRPVGPDIARPVGFADPNESTLAVTYLTVNGVTIRAVYEVEPPGH